MEETVSSVPFLSASFSGLPFVFFFASQMVSRKSGATLVL